MPGIEIDVRVQLLLDEVVVLKRDALQFHRDLEQRIMLGADGVEHLVAGLLHHLGARIVVLVHAMAKAHQAEARVLVLRLLDVLGNAIDSADLLQHVQCRLVGAAVARPPQAGNAGRDARERVGA